MCLYQLETFAFAQKKDEALIMSKTEAVKNELKFLKSQINPHFLFNSLNNIYSLSMIDSVKTQQSILYLSDMLRYVLYDCEKTNVAIEKEVTYIKDFINLFCIVDIFYFLLAVNSISFSSSVRLS